MDGSHEGSGARELAERLFASFTEQGGAVRNGTRAGPAPQPQAPIPDEPRPAERGEGRALAAAALAATDRIAEAVDIVGSQVDATAAELAVLRRTVERALAATDDRLAAIERTLLAED